MAPAKLLILDLDETLIHARVDPLERAPDFTIEELSIYVRPHARDFVAFCSLHFRVAVWTSGSESYAKAVVENLFGASYPLEFLWARERCTAVRDFESQTREWLKDLKKVRRRGYALDQVLMIDDTPKKLMRHYGNLICIHPFEGDHEDAELRLLMPYLLELQGVPNVRSVDKRAWRSAVAHRHPDGL